MSAAARGRLYLRQARAEGLAAVWARWRDRRGEARRNARFRRVPLAAMATAVRAFEAPLGLINVLGSPPWLRLGGVQMQLRSRWPHECRPRALLYPLGRAWRLDLEWGESALATDFVRAPQAHTSARDASLEEALRQVATALGVRAAHVENLAGLPAASLGALGQEGFEWAVSLHDFAAFCPRPTLIEQPHGRFCEYSRDALRCAACLRHADPGPDQDVRRWRADAARLLDQARALVFPSEFLRAQMTALMPDLDVRRQQVLAPSLDGLAPSVRPASAARPSGELRQVAFVGAARLDKGVHVFEQVVCALRASSSALRFSAYGGGTPEALARLRRLGVAVHGFHEPGSLSTRLRRDGVDLALLLSVWPETYALTLDECVAAGVWALAFDVGALGARIRAWRCGQVLPLASGAAGVQAALGELLTSGAPPVPAGTMEHLPRAEAAAAQHLELYRTLGWLN